MDAFVIQYARHWVLFSVRVSRYWCRNGLYVLESVWELVIVRSTRFEYARVHRSLDVLVPLKCLATMKVVKIPLKKSPKLFQTASIGPEFVFICLNVPCA